MKRNILDFLKRALPALALAASVTACSSELDNAGTETANQEAVAQGIRLRIQTPTPDKTQMAARAARETVAAEATESKVYSLSLYIFGLNTQETDAASADDENFVLLRKHEDITFTGAGEPGKTGTDTGSGSLSYTEPISSDLLGKQVKVLLVANDKAAGAQEQSTTLKEFKMMKASGILSEGGSSDLISGNICAADAPTPTGIPMTATASDQADQSSAQLVTLTPLGIDMQATLERIVARVDVVQNTPNMTIHAIRMINVPARGYLFAQSRAEAPADASPVSIRSNSCYDSDADFGYDNSGNNTRKQMFYLYEQNNSAQSCTTLRIWYTLDMGYKQAEGSFDVPFKKSTSEYVPTSRNTLYTVILGDGKEASDVNNIAVVKVNDWDAVDIDNPFDPGHDAYNDVVKPEDARIGDYYLADGTLRRSSHKLTAQEKQQVVGVVFQTDPNRIGTAEKEALAQKGVSSPHGLVMCIKMVSKEKLVFAPKLDDPIPGMVLLPNGGSNAEAYKAIEGLKQYQAFKAYQPDLTDFPAYAALEKFRSTFPAPEQSTGWYIPAIGNWWDIIRNLVGITQLDDMQNESDDESWWIYYDRDLHIQGDSDYYVSKKLNEILKKTSGQADLLSEDTDGLLMTSSFLGGWIDQGYISGFFRVESYQDKIAYSFDNYTTDMYHIRPILAF